MDRFPVRISFGRLGRPGRSSHIPDLVTFPLDRAFPLDDHDDALELRADPALLVVEIWLPWTAAYDVDTKLPA